jgi:DNA-binding transcriptional regulator YiaG
MVETITLTWGERVWIWRRRQRLTLVEAGYRLAVSRSNLVDWEADRSEPPHEVQRRVVSIIPTLPEELRVLRRRSRLGSRGAAEAYGISHVSLLRLEQVGDVQLKRWYLRKSNRLMLVTAPEFQVA